MDGVISSSTASPSAKRYTLKHTHLGIYTNLQHKTNHRGVNCHAPQLTQVAHTVSHTCVYSILLHTALHMCALRHIPQHTCCAVHTYVHTSTHMLCSTYVRTCAQKAQIFDNALASANTHTHTVQSRADRLYIPLRSSLYRGIL